MVQARHRPADGDASSRARASTLTTLTGAQIRDGNGGADARRAHRSRSAQRSLKDTPLWFYVLREAELNNGKLKGVGARIVAETFHRAMEGSQSRSCATRRGARRSARTLDTFRMVDLLLFAFEGKKALLAPLG